MARVYWLAPLAGVLLTLAVLASLPLGTIQ